MSMYSLYVYLQINYEYITHVTFITGNVTGEITMLHEGRNIIEC